MSRLISLPNKEDNKPYLKSMFSSGNVGSDFCTKTTHKLRTRSSSREIRPIYFL